MAQAQRHSYAPVDMKVVIVGGGWAGLAAAVELVLHGARVTILEAAPQLGGRARSVSRGAITIDNGQHVLLGAYRAILSLLRTLDVPEEDVFRRLPLQLTFRSASGPMVRLRAPRLPAPAHLLWAITFATGLSWRERIAALRFAARMRRGGFRVQPDTSAAAYLRQHGQSEDLIRRLWTPLCLAALNTPIEIASAAVFVRVLRDAFFQRRKDSDLLLPIADLGHCLPVPAATFLAARGADVRLGIRVSGLDVGKGRVQGVLHSDGAMQADHVIYAVGPRACHALLAAEPQLAATAALVGHLDNLPICTAYLQFPPAVSLGEDMLGVHDATIQWLFDRGRLGGPPGLIAAVISGPGRHMALDQRALLDLAAREVAALFPAWPRPVDAWVIREKQATFAASVGSDAHRPPARTPVQGLWLAGDYIAGDYPGTLESAVRSGVECARLILNQDT
jgi:squalene-associated FAD-dependent desaturase